jgi:hypothetical protein
VQKAELLIKRTTLTSVATCSVKREAAFFDRLWVIVLLQWSGTGYLSIIIRHKVEIRLLLTDNEITF